MASQIAINPHEANLGNVVVLRIPGKNDIYSSNEFWELCKLNPELQLEKNSDGSVVIMTPTGGDSGHRNMRLGYFVQHWTFENATGMAFDSSTLFEFPDGSIKSPDASWILLDRWNRLTPKEQEGIPPIVPDFVAELKSPSDNIRRLREKMLNYLEAGVRLAWLLDPKTRSVEIYRPGKEVERIENASSVSGAPELPGFVLDLGKVW